MLKADSVTYVNGVKLNKYLLTEHNPNKIDLPPKRTLYPLSKITIHNTESLKNSVDDAEQYTRATVNGNMRTVRTHAYVNYLGAWQNLPWDYANWTCADGMPTKEKPNQGPGNYKTIALECIMSGNGSANDETSMDNCARLAAWLLVQNGLTCEDLRTHTFWLHVRDGNCKETVENYDYWCTKPHPYKTCPAFIIPRWTEFKALVKRYYETLGGASTTETATPVVKASSTEHKLPYLVKITTPTLNIRKSPGTSSEVVGTVRKGEVYTIVEQELVGTVPWGKLKSGVGWISLLSKYSSFLREVE